MSHQMVVGHFSYVDDCVNAIRALRKDGRDFQTYSAFPNHELEDAMYEGQKRSRVRMFTLTGGVTGCCGAFLMTIWMSQDYPMRTSAKPIISIPAFVIPGFECTILLGGLFTFLAVFLLCRLPSFSRPHGYQPVFSEGTFGITLRVPTEEAEELKSRLEQFGAQKVEVTYVR